MSMAHVLRLARHEWRLILKEPRFLLPFLVTPTLILGIQAIAVFLPAAAFAGDAEVLSLARSLAMTLAVMGPSLAVPLGADTFAGERERNTLEILLCLPVGAFSLFWGKVLGILPLPVLVGLAGQGLLLVLVGFRLDIPAEHWEAVLRPALLTPAIGAFFCSVSALLSMGAETVRGAAQLSSLAMLALFATVLGTQGRLYASAGYFAGMLAALAIGSAVCLVLARRRFLRLP